MKKILSLTVLVLALTLSACSLEEQALLNDGLNQNGVKKADDAIVVNMDTENCGECEPYIAPDPSWCADGTIIPAERDECGCLGRDTCLEDRDTVLDEINCARIGQSPRTFDYTTGKNFENPIYCCPGLVEISRSEMAADGLISMSIGGPGFCAPCGNGLCEPEYGENTSNCRLDCK